MFIFLEITFGQPPDLKTLQKRKSAADLLDEFSKETDNNLGWDSSAKSNLGENIKGVFDRQIVTTANVIQDILRDGNCDLTNLKDAQLNHRKFINSLLKISLYLLVTLIFISLRLLL